MTLEKIEITRKIILQFGRVVKASIDPSIVSSGLEKIIKKGVERHNCIAIENLDYETLVVLTKNLPRKIGNIEHLTTKLTNSNYLGYSEPQYAVIRPILRLKKETVILKVDEGASVWWETNKDLISNILVEPLNNPENIINLSELSIKLLGG